jgi:hypothetical protein
LLFVVLVIYFCFNPDSAEFYVMDLPSLEFGTVHFKLKVFNIKTQKISSQQQRVLSFCTYWQKVIVFIPAKISNKLSG